MIWERIGLKGEGGVRIRNIGEESSEDPGVGGLGVSDFDTCEKMTTKITGINEGWEGTERIMEPEGEDGRRVEIVSGPKSRKENGPDLVEGLGILN